MHRAQGTDIMIGQETRFTEEESGEVEEAASDAGVSVENWLRGAAIIRLFTENDEEYLAEAVDERGDTDDE